MQESVQLFTDVEAGAVCLPHVGLGGPGGPFLAICHDLI